MTPDNHPSARHRHRPSLRRKLCFAAIPLLGCVPRPGFASADNQWRAQVTIDAQAIRTEVD